jgi:hypothetical protein
MPNDFSQSKESSVADCVKSLFFLEKSQSNALPTSLTTERASKCTKLSVVLRGPRIPSCLRLAYSLPYRPVLGP